VSLTSGRRRLGSPRTPSGCLGHPRSGRCPRLRGAVGAAGRARPDRGAGPLRQACLAPTRDASRNGGRGASLQVSWGRGASEEARKEGVGSCGSSQYLGFPPVLLRSDSELLRLLTPRTAHGDVDALHVLLQVHHHLWLRHPTHREKASPSPGQPGGSKGPSPALWEGARQRSPLDEDIPDAAGEVAEGTRLW